jgi:hypothetical protein
MFWRQKIAGRGEAINAVPKNLYIDLFPIIFRKCLCRILQICR